MWQYQMMADWMIEYKLMINFHGSGEADGRGRTWPNFMTAEGIMGMEHYQWSKLPTPSITVRCRLPEMLRGRWIINPPLFQHKEQEHHHGPSAGPAGSLDSGLTNYALALRYMEGWKGTDFLR